MKSRVPIKEGKILESKEKKLLGLNIDRDLTFTSYL